MEEKNTQPINSKQKYDSVSIFAFILGILAIFFGSLYIFSIGAFIIGLAGVYNCNKNGYRGMWMSLIGLILGILMLIAWTF